MMMSNYVLFIYNIHWFPILRVAVLWLSAEGTFLAGTEIESEFLSFLCVFFPENRWRVICKVVKAVLCSRTSLHRLRLLFLRWTTSFFCIEAENEL